MFDSTVRAFDNEVNVVKSELKRVEQLVLSTRDSQSSIFARAVGDFEARHQLVMGHLKKYNERVNEAVAHLDNTKAVLMSYDKKINQLNMDNMQKLDEKFEKFKYEMETRVQDKFREIDLSVLNQNRYLSDINKHQLELENYIEKYLPYNSLVDVLHMLT